MGWTGSYPCWFPGRCHDPAWTAKTPRLKAKPTSRTRVMSLSFMEGTSSAGSREFAHGMFHVSFARVLQNPSHGQREEREKHKGDEPDGVSRRAQVMHGECHHGRNQEPAEGAEPADPTRGSAHGLRYRLRHDLEHRGVADAHAKGHQDFARNGKFELARTGHDQRAHERDKQRQNR